MALGYDQHDPHTHDTNTDTNTEARPYALAFLWSAIMAPVTLLLGAIQPLTGIPYQVLPLVMVGPLVAAVICRWCVPSWFPADAARASAASTQRAWVAVALTSFAYVAALIILVTPGYTPFVVHDWLRPVAIVAVCIGFTVGSWCEEVGFRGVMYRALAVKLGAWPSVLINGAFFGLCHLQYFEAGIVPVVLFVASAVLLDVIMAAIWTGTWVHRVLIATAIHAVVNISLEATGADLTHVYAYVAMLVATLLSAVCALVFGRIFKIGDFTPTA